MALSQLSRDIESRHPPVPVLSNLRDSGAIEQDADLVIFIYRGDLYQPNEAHIWAQLLLAKQRNGPIGTVFLTFHTTLARFVERANPHHERHAQSRLL
jgi:replicative DNA helicase